jgi:type I restriction enzyme S subunit
MKSYKGVFQGDCEPLQFFCESITDCHHSTPVYLPDGKLVVRNFNIKNGRMLLENVSFTDDAHFDQRITREKPEAGDLIITREAPMGEVCIIPEGVECCLGQRMVLIKPDLKKVDKQFLLYALLSDYSQTQIEQSNGTGSIVSNLRIPVLKELRVPKFKLATQKSIGEILGSIDEKIELNNKINTELEVMTKLIYDYCFVQFDFPDTNGNPYKSSGGKMIYNEELKREIPDGWEVKKVKDVAFTGSGGTPLKSKKEYYNNGSVPWINSGEVNAPFIIKAKKFITQLGVDKSSAKLFTSGTILMAMYGATAGKVSFINFEATTNQAICAINPHNENYNFYLKFGLEDLYDYLVNLSSGSARDNLSQDKIKELKFSIPTGELLEKYHLKVQPMMDKILSNMKENSELTELRDWLLPMLMNGQVTVKDA